MVQSSSRLLKKTRSRKGQAPRVMRTPRTHCMALLLAHTFPRQSLFISTTSREQFPKLSNRKER